MKTPFVVSNIRVHTEPPADAFYLDMQDPSPIALDFETFYHKISYSVAKMGIHRYVQDYQFEVLLTAVGSPTECMAWFGVEGVPWKQMACRPWISHNREFDRTVYLRLVEQGLAPELPPDHQWWCTADLCAYFQFPRALNDALDAVNQFVVGDTLPYEPLDKAMRDEMSGKDLESIRDLYGMQQARFAQYGGIDASACAFLWSLLGEHWPEHERELSNQTDALNAVGVFINSPYVKEGIDQLDHQIEQQKDRYPFSHASPLKVKNAIQAIDPTFPGTTNKKAIDLVEWLKKDPPPESAALDILNWVWNVRELHKVQSDLKTIWKETLYAPRLHPRLVYFGAATGRWTSRGGLNTQTLKKAETAGVDVRKCFVPAPGKIFATADFSQVEVRCFFWVAHDFDTLDKIRSGMNPYEAYARSNLSFKGDGALKEVDPNLYAMVKASVLSLGYGVGGIKFQETAKAIHGIEMDLDQAFVEVDKFRGANPAILDAWSWYSQKLHHSVSEGFAAFPLPVSYQYDGILRKLYYRDLMQEDSEITYRKMAEGAWKRNHRNKIYGAKVFQNFVQATARDVFGFAWLRCLKHGFNPVLSIHDELVFELDEAEAEAEQARLKGVMEQAPAWADSLPLSIDIKLMEGYGK